jgi:hypothetical protein
MIITRMIKTYFVAEIFARMKEESQLDLDFRCSTLKIGSRLKPHIQGTLNGGEGQYG